MPGAKAKVKVKPKSNIGQELRELRKRVKNLEKALDVKDREIREISISRTEVVQEFGLLKETLSKLGTTQAMIEKLSKLRDIQVASKDGEGEGKGETELEFSYRDRMILLNRIDIYRLFLTIIIVSSKLKYPRKLNKKEESDLKKFINDLDKFETLILNMNINDDKIWETGRDCEKRILHIFNEFFCLK